MRSTGHLADGILLDKLKYALSRRNMKMACDFSIEFSQTAERLVASAESAITRAGGQFSGDAISGNFSISAAIGSLKGSYTIQGSMMNVNISSKPVFLSCSMIENQVRKYLTAEHT